MNNLMGLHARADRQHRNTALGRALELAAADGVHAQYASNQNVIPGTTTPEWIVDWSHGLINQ